MTSAPQQINLAALPTHELKHLVEQMQQEVDILSNSLQSLKSAQSQFAESKSCLELLQKSEKGKEILVPMSGCLYVPGNLNETENVMVDIGTGYYVEKKTKDAEEYFNRKVDYLKRQMESLQTILQQKFQNKQMVTEVLQTKLIQQSQQK
ncbi:prefoldin subunit 5-like [Styela clava]|uniref:prefoldin subunit 5-like n=1 Tax=Styela clava TaxID=7725 RepID=UPI0019395A5D|nr:prefoldin subunit 5-like [Styela clava]